MPTLRSSTRRAILSGAVVAWSLGGLASLVYSASDASAATCGSTNWIGHAATSATPHNTYFCNPATVDVYGGTLLQVATQNTYDRMWVKEQGGGWADCFEGYDRAWTMTGRDRGAGEVQLSSNTAPC